MAAPVSASRAAPWRAAPPPAMLGRMADAPLPDTAFPATARAVRASLADAPFDAASFERPLARCALARCHGTCCAEGVYLNPEVAAVVRTLERRHGDFLAGVGLDTSSPLVVEEPEEEGPPSVRTARRPKAFHALVPDYPYHFPDTACAFLTPDARCALQLLAEREGRHPWHYKPLACWLHPISLAPSGIRLHDRASDPYPGGFTTATHCGRTVEGGRPAREVLAAELEYLGAMLGREL